MTGTSTNIPHTENYLSINTPPSGQEFVKLIQRSLDLYLDKNTLRIRDTFCQGTSTTQRQLLTPNQGPASCNPVLYSVCLLYSVTTNRPALPNVLVVLFRTSWYISTQHSKIKTTTTWSHIPRNISTINIQSYMNSEVPVSNLTL